MAEVKQLPKREEVPVELTWDLTKIYATDTDFEADFAKVKKEAENFKKYQGKLKENGDTLLEAIKEMFAIQRRLENVYVYASMKNDQDTANAENQAKNATVQKLVAEVSEKLSWFQPELLHLTIEELEEAKKQAPELNEYSQNFREWFEMKDHVLSDKEEALLAGASDIFSAPESTFEILNDADLKFPVMKDENGDDVELSEGIYGKLLESTDRRVRKEAFQNLYKVYRQFRHTFAMTLSSHNRTENYVAKVRNYSTAQEAALANNHIPVSVYDTLINVTNKHLPLLHRYVALRKKLLNLDEVHMYDLYTPITGEPTLKYTYDEAKEEALKALAVLGDDYLSHVKEAFDNRWIDVVANQGKRGGAYSGGSYDTAPYILLNWQDTLDNLFTLVHEMGHTIHSYYTRHNQPYQYGDYSIFVAEIASTTNENLLTQYLLDHFEDKKVRAYVLNHYLDGFKGTVFRQTQFAEFEKWSHEQDAAGKPLTADVISKYYGELNKRYYGPDIFNDDEISLEWARIPHFYYNYYVYQYATGFAAATTLAQNILNDNPADTQAYLTYLKSGSSEYPIDIMKKAGVDMTNEEYLEKAFDVFEKRLNELEKLIG